MKEDAKTRGEEDEEKGGRAVGWVGEEQMSRRRKNRRKNKNTKKLI